MSCFVMNQESISTLAAFIADMLNFPHEFQLSLPDGIYQFAECDYPDDPNLFDESKIYEKLYRLNLAAYHERYGREPNESDEIPGFRPLRYEIPPRIWSHIRIDGHLRGIHTILPEHYAILKTFNCYLYQTNEGNCADCDLRKELKTLRDGPEKFIINNTPEYVIAPWG